MKKSRSNALKVDISLLKIPLIQFNLREEIKSYNEEAAALFGITEGQTLTVGDIHEALKGITHAQSGQDELEGTREISINNRIYQVINTPRGSSRLRTLLFVDISPMKNELRLRLQKIGRLQKRIRFLTNQNESSRNKIARALDSEVGRSLSYLSAKLNTVHQEQPVQEVERNLLDEISPILNKTIEDIKSITDDLYPKMLREMGLNISLRALIDEVSKDRRMTAVYQSVHFTERLPYEIEINIYYIIKELLAAIIRWPGLHQFGVKAAKQENSLNLTIEYGGSDIHSLESEIDIPRMLEGVEIMNGAFSMDVSDPATTTLFIEIPLEAQDGERED